MLFQSNFQIPVQLMKAAVIPQPAFRNQYFKQAASELGQKIVSVHPFKKRDDIRDEEMENYKLGVVVFDHEKWYKFLENIHKEFPEQTREKIKDMIIELQGQEVEDGK